MLTQLTLVVRLIEVGVLLVSGTSKLVTQTTREAFRDSFSAVTPFPPRFSGVVPLAELTIALLLMVWPSHLTHIVVAALFLAFSIVVFRLITRPDITSCNCFGSMGTDRTTWLSLVRNVLLLVGALMTLFVPTSLHVPGLDVVVVFAVLGTALLTDVEAVRVLRYCVSTHSVATP